MIFLTFTDLKNLDLNFLNWFLDFWTFRWLSTENSWELFSWVIFGDCWPTNTILRLRNFLTFLCHFWPFKSLLEPFRELLRVSLRCPWSVLEVSLSVLKCPWSVLKCPWSVLKMSLNVLEVSLSVLEVTLSVLEVTSTWPSGMFYLETTSSFSDEGLILTCFKKGLILNCLGLVMCPDCHWSRCLEGF